MATCFVVQGFGRKTDFTDGRVLDLDASYAIIKEAVEAAGLDCLRADEITHSGTIDAPMYRQLLEADLVIADLSTYNVNAAFELGIRYALRRRATIVIAEEQFKSPFDVGHIAIRRYKHLGEDIGAKEAKRFRDELIRAIGEIMAGGAIDSPVYTFLPGLVQPERAAAEEAAAPAPVVAPASAPKSTPGVFAHLEDMVKSVIHSQRIGLPEIVVPDRTSQSAKSALDQALESIKAGDFARASLLLEDVRRQRPNDSFVVQQLALATYKSQQPTAEAALLAARDILRELSPATTNDPETLGLWGAIHKRLWQLNHDMQELDESIGVCERGFHLKQDHYNGINLAALIEQRALTALRSGERDEGLADVVLARRIRRQVVRIALPLLDTDMEAQKRFWIVATLREAAVGLGDDAAAAGWQAEAQALAVPAEMLETSDAQCSAVKAAQAEIARLGAATGQGA